MFRLNSVNLNFAISGEKISKIIPRVYSEIFLWTQNISESTLYMIFVFLFGNFSKILACEYGLILAISTEVVKISVILLSKIMIYDHREEAPHFTLKRSRGRRAGFRTPIW